MTSLVIEQFHAPDTQRRALRLESVRRRAADQLAGRSVWCIAAAPLERDAADALQRCLRPVRDEGVASQRRSLQLDEPLIGLMERLDAMLRGVRMLGPELGSGEQDAYLKGRQDADALIAAEVQAGDVVVLHDPIAAALATAIRERGAHAIWRTSIGRWESNATAAWWFLHRSAPALDAHITGGRSERTGWLGAQALAAYTYISAPGVVSAEAMDATRPGQRAEEICWTTLLADVVRDDRAERVGGAVRARPAVAAR